MDWQVLGTWNAGFQLHSVHSVDCELCVEKCHGGKPLVALLMVLPAVIARRA